jgi:glycosyltransferase involved in cell wall biosynthesis
VYRNRDSIPELVEAVEEIGRRVEGGLEVVFVIDGTPDDSHQRLLDALGTQDLQTRIVEHSRNFGSLAAVRTGMGLARGERIAIMSADLQEPPELVVEFMRRLAAGEAEVVAGERASRDDRGDAISKLYWRLYRRFVVGDIPASGVDVFACTAEVRDVLCSLEPVHTSLVAQLFWVGFRRQLVPYDRKPSPGPSGWTFAGKLRYLSDSVFAFTDLPVRILWIAGLMGLGLGLILGSLEVIARIAGTVTVPGYTATVLVVTFFGSLNMIGLGIIGSYVWRAYETAKGRPGAVVSRVTDYPMIKNDE